MTNSPPIKRITLPGLVLAPALAFLALMAPAAGVGAAKDSPAGSPSALERRCLRVLEEALEKPETTLAAGRALGDLGHREAIARLREELQQRRDDPFAFASLVWLGLAPYVDQARAALSDGATPTGVATTYGVALVRNPDRAVTARLFSIWSDEREDPMERLWAAGALFEMGDERPRDYLRGLLTNRDPYVAVLAAGALFARGDAAGTRHLRRELADRRSPHWDQVAVRLGEYPAPEQLDALVRALRRARHDLDRVWLAWAVLRHKGYHK